MSLETAIAPGVRPGFVDMDTARAVGPARRVLHRLHGGLAERLTHYLIGRLARADARNPDALLAEVERWRWFRDRFEPSHAASMSIEAVRTAGPHLGLPSPPVPSDWFAPIRGEPRGFVFYVHGGSFIFERSPAVTDVVARIAALAGARVFAPNYRLAPEHRCPAAVDDVVEAFRWFRRTWPDEPVTAMAESAGCAVLLAALQRLRREDGVGPDGVLLLSPWVDLALQSWTVVASALAGMSPTTVMALSMMAHLYLGDAPASDPVASPLYGDFTGFPPMLIHASRGDALYGDAVRLADRVRDCGGDLTVRQWTDEGHVWEKANTANAARSIELGAEFIRRCLA